MLCEIILVVHALTEWNLAGRCQGHVDTPLCAQGHSDALALALKLQHEHIDAIYTSDLRRALETGQYLARLKCLPIRMDQRLREGRWAFQERTDEYPTLPSSVDVEDGEAVKSRMIEAMTEIADRHSGERVVVVSHAGPVKRFVQHIRACKDDPLPPFRGIRAAINRLIYDHGSWLCLALDVADHLGAAGEDAKDESVDPPDHPPATHRASDSRR